jgi:uncharacterized protein (TIGR03435 family)
MTAKIACLLFVIVGAAFAQSVDAPRFEVAVIKLSNAGTNASSGIGTGRGRVNAHNVTLKRCIMGAYGIGPHQIAGGPDWLDSERFDITGKAEKPTNDDDLFMAMLQSLLAERFKLAFHHETRTIPAYVLEVGKNGPKLEKAGDGESVTNTNGSNLGVAMDARFTGMKRFAEVLAREIDLPVVDQTGLAGVFNFKLQWTRDTAKMPDRPTIYTAVQEQLGLRLRSQKMPLEILVIDRAERPSEN